MNILIYLTLLSVVVGEPFHDASEEFINYINNAQSSWRAGKNFEENTPISFIVNKLGALSGIPSDVQRNDRVIDENGEVIPNQFDARDHWSKCKDIIGHIPDQSACQSDWVREKLIK